MSLDAKMLEYTRKALQTRLIACEDAAAGKEDHGDEARQAISQEALWLSALWTQINEYIETGETPFAETAS